jgi:N utilization substance protein B
MLNRRHIRIKVLQAFYAFSQSNNNDLENGLKEFVHSMNKTYDLYIYLIQIFIPLKRIANIKIEEAKRSFIEKAPQTFKRSFVDNKVIKMLESSEDLEKIINNSKISWVGDVENDLIKKMFSSLYNSETFQEILNSEENSFDQQKTQLTKLYKEEICNYDLLHHVSSMIIKTLKSFKEDSKFTLMPLWKEDEKQFALNLLSKAITNKEHNDKVLQSYSKNWESERLAKMDSLLMNLAVTEAKEFSSIPLKVTLNEYIEISKFYSTPKSNG